MERPSKRLRSVTEEELSGDADNEKGAKVIVVDDSDSEFLEDEHENPQTEVSMDDLLVKLRSAIVKDDLTSVEQVLKSLSKIEGHIEALNTQDSVSGRKLRVVTA